MVLLVATLAVFAWVGFRARGGAEDLEEYTTARDSQGVAALGLSFFASGMGAWILFAPPEVGAGVGLVAALGYAIGAAAPLVVFALLGGRLRAVAPRGHGLTEFVRLRFGRTFHAYVVAISILYMLIFVTAELTAVGAVAAITAGIAPWVATVGVALVTLAYTAYGGLRASLRTDRWQAWLILVLLAIGVVAVLGGLRDGPGALTRSGLLGVDAIGVQAAVTLVIAIVAANLFHQGYWQRVFAARSTRALAGGAGIGMAATAPVVAVAGVVGIVAAGSGLDLGSPPVPFFALMATVPAWVNLAVLVLGLSLVASSVDTLENGLASLVVSERPSMDVGAARAVTVVLVLPALAVALQGYSVLRLFLIADLLCAATVVPAMLGLWSHATAGAALAGAVAGLVGAVAPGWVTTGSLVEGAVVATFPQGVPTLPPFAGAVLASSAVAVAGSLLSRRTTDLAELGMRIPTLERT
ncbi:MAG: sodium:solute symporter [Actinobacteria bacterium]|nr:sodium:solute symporter [Actinomycetota bacterium]